MSGFVMVKVYFPSIPSSGTCGAISRGRWHARTAARRSSELQMCLIGSPAFDPVRLLCNGVRHCSADDGVDHPDILDGIRIHVVRILLEDHEVRVFAGGDRAFHLFLV